jgi:deoxyribodipyrimidine photo-lyase
LHAFLTQRFKLYEKRNDPTINATSNLSPWLHFGQIAAQRCALEAKKIPSTKSRDSFLEELIIRRELTDNYCFYNRDGYDKLNGLYPQYNNESWAQKSLQLHRNDPREHVYTRDEFETAQTHDDLWNACQLEMVHAGKMHGFLRMYWAKKILGKCRRVSTDDRCWCCMYSSFCIFPSASVFSVLLCFSCVLMFFFF